MSASEFSKRLIAWQKTAGRQGLPWQNTSDPYRVWLSEIMLQQTQVATVIPYYQRFLERFPTLADLAAAPVEEVMPLWAGLGYYARARNLHKCAQAVVAQHGGEFPRDAALIAELPGIGRSTANAIASFCFGTQTPILDGNVKRVFARCFGIEGFPGTRAVEQEMWALAETLMPARNTGTYTQAQMDLGATVCTRGKPLCARCPLADMCVAYRDGRTQELPVARPKKAVPERESFFLLMRSPQGILLEQRPPSGIWGSLLCLPELPVGSDAASYAREHYGVVAQQWHEQTALRHTFTHFHLTLRPLLADVTLLPQAAESNVRWLNASEFEAAALPTPIRTLLAMSHG
ncbi:MAG TPA: A/G-specific adenine glycosylase [Rhodocyclaceae bacterium]|nr:A/G-specific adenine glycosylase [Rhodocyclaceae bacterium]